MKFIPENLYHVYNQGNNRQQIFFEPKDYFTFLNLFRQLLSPNAETIAWCLMPNHFHFLLFTDERAKQGGIIIDPITNALRKLLSGYARIINQKYQRSGSLFRQKTKAKCLADVKLVTGKTYNTLDYYQWCFHYIHQNPMKANIVKMMEDWEFSSFRDYAGLREGNLCNKLLAANYCGFDENTFYKRSYELIEYDVITSFGNSNEVRPGRSDPEKPKELN